jgi:hypothetical protein
VHLFALVFACGFLVITAGAASARTDDQAVLRLVDLAPVTFRGSDFVARETVRVTVTRQNNTFAKTVRANAQGAFRVTFGLIAIDVCRGYVRAIATGDRGSRAAFKRACRSPDPQPWFRAPTRL